MTIEVNQPAPDRSRFVYYALVVSLAVNLLFFGGLATAAWHHRNGGPGPKGEPGLLGFIKELPPDRQGPVRDEIKAARESMKDLRASVRTAWLDSNGLLTAEPFDKEKFRAALVKLDDAEGRYKQALYAALAETAAKFTPEERKLFQKWRESRGPRLLMRNSDQPGGEGKHD